MEPQQAVFIRGKQTIFLAKIQIMAKPFFIHTLQDFGNGFVCADSFQILTATQEE
jgi:hypothetical protein